MRLAISLSFCLKNLMLNLRTPKPCFFSFGLSSRTGFFRLIQISGSHNRSILRDVMAAMLVDRNNKILYFFQDHEALSALLAPPSFQNSSVLG